MHRNPAPGRPVAPPPPTRYNPCIRGDDKDGTDRCPPQAWLRVDYRGMTAGLEGESTVVERPEADTDGGHLPTTHKTSATARPGMRLTLGDTGEAINCRLCRYERRLDPVRGSGDQVLFAALAHGCR